MKKKKREPYKHTIEYKDGLPTLFTSGEQENHIFALRGLVGSAFNRSLQFVNEMDELEKNGLSNTDSLMAFNRLFDELSELEQAAIECLKNLNLAKQHIKDAAYIYNQREYQK
jgi:hypothetical protein